MAKVEDYFTCVVRIHAKGNPAAVHARQALRYALDKEIKRLNGSYVDVQLSNRWMLGDYFYYLMQGRDNPGGVCSSYEQLYERVNSTRYDGAYGTGRIISYVCQWYKRWQAEREAN